MDQGLYQHFNSLVGTPTERGWTGFFQVKSLEKAFQTELTSKKTRLIHENSRVPGQGNPETP
ncbi:hypothetical protein EHR06_17385 [Leptospira dzoumogneensis]|uniref:Uncharacterized protein n=1 Tax=Leptospira dzoumogneensis TaxID=2484904 RepID=A0A4Z1A9E4_9LEPT|nr:hypothetical protein EHR06_17385 [Leptospira dzoumogneensis]